MTMLEAADCCDFVFNDLRSALLRQLRVDVVDPLSAGKFCPASVPCDDGSIKSVNRFSVIG
jgi:hypothetical protein